MLKLFMLWCRVLDGRQQVYSKFDASEVCALRFLMQLDFVFSFLDMFVCACIDEWGECNVKVCRHDWIEIYSEKGWLSSFCSKNYWILRFEVRTIEFWDLRVELESKSVRHKIEPKVNFFLNHTPDFPDMNTSHSELRICFIKGESLGKFYIFYWRVTW